MRTGSALKYEAQSRSRSTPTTEREREREKHETHTHTHTHTHTDLTCRVAASFSLIPGCSGLSFPCVPGFLKPFYSLHSWV